MVSSWKSKAVKSVNNRVGNHFPMYGANLVSLVIGLSRPSGSNDEKDLKVWIDKTAQMFSISS